MTYNVDSLRDALKADSGNLGIAELLAREPPDTQEIADRLNNKMSPAPAGATIPITEFIDILHKHGVFDALYDAYVGGHPAIKREVGKIVLLRQLGVDTMHLDYPKTLESLAAAGIPQAVLAEVRSRSKTGYRSTAELEWGEGMSVREIDVRNAVFSDSGERLL